MSYIGTRRFGLEVALGNVPGYSRVFKFGKALDCDSGVLTDVWDGADGVTSTDLWVPPTQARTHTIVGAAADTLVGTGMQKVRVYGLADWDSAETSEDLDMAGAGGVATSSFVIIHRMKGIQFGSGGTNAGTITATAATDGTITAAIQPGNGQTLMAIYGIPSTQTFVMGNIDVSILRAAGAAVADVELLVNEAPNTAPNAGWLVKNAFKVDSADAWHQFDDPPVPYAGPCIIKCQVNSNTNNSQVTASFNGYLVDN